MPLAALLVLAALLLGGDRVLLSREVDHVLERAASGRARLAYADGRVTAAVRYSSPALVSPQVAPRVRESLQDLVRQAAAERVGDVRRERQAAAGVRVLPWHTAQREARDRWVAYLDARLARLQAIAADFDALYAVDRLAEQRLAAAREAYAEAAPGQADRVADALGPAD